MINFTDFDRLTEQRDEEYTLPDKVEVIEVMYDRGRLSIYINKEEVFEDYSGASDFSALITNK